MTTGLIEEHFTDYQVVCRTEGCENAGITVVVAADATEPHVVCGPCAQPIADIIPVEEP